MRTSFLLDGDHGAGCTSLAHRPCGLLLLVPALPDLVPLRPAAHTSKHSPYLPCHTSPCTCTCRLEPQLLQHKLSPRPHSAHCLSPSAFLLHQRAGRRPEEAEQLLEHQLSPRPHCAHCLTPSTSLPHRYVYAGRRPEEAEQLLQHKLSPHPHSAHCLTCSIPLPHCCIHPGRKPEEAEQLLRRELDLLIEQGPDRAELARVKKSSRAGLYGALQVGALQRWLPEGGLLQGEALPCTAL